MEKKISMIQGMILIYFKIYGALDISGNIIAANRAPYSPSPSVSIDILKFTDAASLPHMSLTA